MSERFRLLHISDLHLGETPEQINAAQLYREKKQAKPPDVDLLKEAEKRYEKKILKLNSHDRAALTAASAFIYDRRDDYDAIIVSGDLCRVGQKSELKFASEYFFQNTKNFFFDFKRRPFIGNIDKVKFFIPGNHDRYRNIRAGINSREYENYFSGFRKRPIYSANSDDKNGRRLGFVFFDFAFQENSDYENLSHKYGGGYARDSIIQAGIAETIDLRRKFPGIFVIWVNHFAPYECGDELRLVNYSKFLEAARKNNISIVLCGHTHRNNVLKEKSLCVICAGSMSCVDSYKRHYMHLIELRIGSSTVVIRENYIYDTLSESFVLDYKEHLLDV